MGAVRKLLLSVVIVLAAVAAAQARSSLGIGSAEPSAMPGSTSWPFLAFITEQQQAFYRALTGSLKAMRTDPWQLTTLVGLSFAYGVLHAAGPGHGKAVISSYMLANEVALRRGVMLSFMSSFLQGATALAVVACAYLLLRGSSVSMTDTTRFLEIASYALIAAFGGWLLWRKVADSLRRRPGSGASPLAGLHRHGHGEVCSACGHSHAPDPRRLSGRDFSPREAWSAVLAVGLRPCSGALLVLTFSLLNGLYLGGVLSVFAMALGTAITVSALATMAVSAKGLALRYAGESRAAGVASMIEVIGALLVLVLGLLLLAAAVQA